MDKKPRKLVLNKKTIRNLNPTELKEVAGGITLYTCTALNTCYCTGLSMCTACTGCC